MSKGCQKPLGSVAGHGREPGGRWEPPTRLCFQCCTSGFAPCQQLLGKFKNKWNSSGSSEVSWRSLPEVVWVIKAPFSPGLAFSVEFLVGLGGYQPLPLSSPADWDASCALVTAGLCLWVWFGYRIGCRALWLGCTLGVRWGRS